MLKNLRLDKIIELVNNKEYVSLHELMEATKSSESTIRADLVQLEKEQKLIRLHGGAKSLTKRKTLDELDMNEKYNINTKEKEKVAQYAASLIENKMIVYIDAGTTTSYLCNYIDDNSNVFVTNSITIAQKLKKKNLKVYLTGGEIKLSTEAFIGPFTLEILGKFSFDIGFFGANGVSKKEGFTTPDYEEAFVKSTAMHRCKKSYILVDNSKFDQEVGVKFASLSEATIITDKKVDKEYKNERVITVDK